MSLAYREFVNRDVSLIERRCLTKAAFVSRREALALARRGRRADGQLRPYSCRHCGSWHLGHTGKRR